MAATMERVQVMSMALGYVVGQALHAAAKLNIADLLADGPRHLDELTTLTQAHRSSLYRLLRTLSSAGVFAEDERGCFSLTALGETLRSEGPASVRAAVMWVSEPLHYGSCGELTESIMTGKPAFESIFGMSYFDRLATDPEAGRIWDEGMACFSGMENAPIAQAYDFPASARVIDLGGGQGGFLVEVLRANPSLRGVLFDLPEVVATPREIVAAGLSGRCETIGGNFFTALPGGGDVYILKRVLHDWDDETCIDLLRRCRETMPSTARVLVIDAVIPPGNDPHPAKIVDLVMLSILPGRERTEREFQSLFAAAGLRLTRVIPTHSMLSIVEGVLA